jgi:hypothetical protein
MTHDELLSRIDKNWDDDYDYCDVQRDKALRAVVELHKPFQVATGGSWTPEGSTQTFETTCNHCGQLNSAAMVLYPCPTVQAIEKELA